MPAAGPAASPSGSPLQPASERARQNAGKTFEYFIVVAPGKLLLVVCATLRLIE
jgi:hypothetical protein